MGEAGTFGDEAAMEWLGTKKGTKEASLFNVIFLGLFPEAQFPKKPSFPLKNNKFLFLQPVNFMDFSDDGLAWEDEG